MSASPKSPLKLKNSKLNSAAAGKVSDDSFKSNTSSDLSQRRRMSDLSLTKRESSAVNELIQVPQQDSQKERKAVTRRSTALDLVKMFRAQ